MITSPSSPHSRCCAVRIIYILFLFDSCRAAYLVPAGNFLDAGESEDQAYNKDNEECAEETGIGTGGVIHDICGGDADTCPNGNCGSQYRDDGSRIAASEAESKTIYIIVVSGVVKPNTTQMTA